VRESGYRPSLLCMLSSDYRTAVWLSVPIVVWLIYLIIPFFRLPLFTYTAIGFTVLCLGLWVHHWLKVRALLATGVVVPGRVKAVTRERSRGRVSVTFNHGDKGYAQTLTVARSKQTDALEEGQEVRLIVASDDVERVLLLDLYIRPPRPTL